MAITPISQFRGQENSIVQILQGGSNVISNILNQAVQLGRDRSNNQARQEDQMFKQRSEETALAQRRGENLTSLIQDSQKMSMAQREADRRYALLERQDIRNADQMLFNRDVTDQEMGIKEQQLGMQQERDVFNRDLATRELGFKEQNAQRDSTLDSLRIKETEQQMALRQSAEERAKAEFARQDELFKKTGGVKPPSFRDILAQEQFKYKMSQDAKLEKERKAAFTLDTLTSNERLTPNQRKKALDDVQTFSQEWKKSPEETLPKLSAETQALVNNEKFKQKDLELPAAVTANSFEEYFAGVNEKDLEGTGLTKKSPEVINHYRRIYENAKTLAGDDDLTMVLPPKGAVGSADPLKSLYEGL